MSEKVILVTGATDGIGKETARVLSAAGHRVITHGRKRGTADVHGDLSSMREVRALAEQVHAACDHLDVLVNNAGIFAKKREVTADGFELTLAVNHFSHFLLTHLVMDLLRKSPHEARVVNVSSGVHASGEVDPDDLQMEHGWTGYGAYASSKLMNVLFTVELARRLQGTNVTVNALHPGVIATKLLRSGFGGGGASVDTGAATSVMVATSPKLRGVTGRFFSSERETTPSRRSQDPALAKALYETSARLVGVSPIDPPEPG